MIDKKKMQFVRLCLIFTAIVVLTLMYEWGRPQAMQAGSSMMSQSMGGMMSSMHLGNVTIGDLIYQEESHDTEAGMSSHHSGGQGELGRIHYFTTITIVALLPFITAGTIFLSIVWIK